MTEHRTSSVHPGGRVEVDRHPDGGVTVRDADDPESGMTLEFTHEEWVAFLAGVRNGEFDPS